VLEQPFLPVYQFIFYYADLLYLGFPTKSHTSAGGIFSVTKSREKMRCKSLKALAGSLLRASRASSGFVAKSLGTGPLTVAPSKYSVVTGHSARRAEATASLGGRCRKINS
jgi:hypothetical protein